MAKKQLSQNLRIVCEGANTEPNYFQYLANNVLAKEKWKVIEITPKPKNQDAPLKRIGSNLNRKTRQPEKIASFSPAKEYEAVPLRYVAEVLNDLENDIYSEGWAVYDKNGHPKHDKAWVLKGDMVKIALSARSFEHWILLHFEKNLNPFLKTECKKDKKTPNGCGTIKPVDAAIDCVKQSNIICLCGYLRHKYIPNYGKGLTKSEDIAHFQKLMKILEKRLLIAFENAAWLRFKMHSQLVENNNLPYLVNPYTNVDELVKSILNISTEFIWAKIDKTLIIAHNEKIKIALHNQCINIEYAGSFNLVKEDFCLRSLDCDLNGIYSKYDFTCDIILDNRQKNINLTHTLPTLANTVLIISRFTHKTILFELF